MAVISNTDSYNHILSNYNPQANTTMNIMTKYEKAKLVGLRLQQIADGAEPTIDTKGYDNIREIVLEELRQKKLPFMIRRDLPLGNKEYWRLEDLIILE